MTEQDERTFYCQGHKAYLPASAFDKPSIKVRNCRECKHSAYEEKKRKVRERAQRLKNEPTETGKKRCTQCLRSLDESEFISPRTGKLNQQCNACYDRHDRAVAKNEDHYKKMRSERESNHRKNIRSESGPSALNESDESGSS